VYIPAKLKKKKLKWTFPISLMFKWKPDTDDLIKRCFEFDWAMTKIPRVVKNGEDLQNVKKFLSENYRQIRNTYKQYASMNPVSDIWAIQNLEFNELISRIAVIDNKLVFDADVNLK